MISTYVLEPEDTAGGGVVYGYGSSSDEYYEGGSGVVGLRKYMTKEKIEEAEEEKWSAKSTYI